MISTPLFILVLALATGIGIALGWLAASSRVSKVNLMHAEDAAALRENVAQAEARAERLLEENEGLIQRSRTDANVLRALSPITAQLDQVSAHVQRLETTAAAQHSEMVAHMRREAQIGAELSTTTASLNAALRSTSARGQWGEVQLRRIVEAAGMLEHVDVDFQVGSAQFAHSGKGKSSASRPDAIIHLPGDGHLAIDAKTPMDAYLLAVEISADDTTALKEREELLAKHAKALRSHVGALIKRNYPGDFPDSPQVTILFLPSESLLAQATQADPTLLEYALGNGVVLASPSSLLAILRAVASVWTSEAATSEAREIVDLGRTLVERIGVVVAHLDRLGKSLGQSVNHYNAAVHSIESRLLVSARSLSSLQPGTPDKLTPPPQLADKAAHIAQIRSPELVQELETRAGERGDAGLGEAGE
ncbi:DNA recombination protein RmuC [Trueperella pyogenes]|uniref:DNA recombination protein RmuC n=1 Tax=Trueperella pyogenes TaxID=1661 RepID=UPI003132A17A